MAVSMCELPGARFDLVLMDLAMPDLDGYVATTEIRRLPGCRDLPIVGWSSRVDSRAKDAALAAGMNDLVERRYDADSVAAVIRRWIAT
jgi:CheY-like chemotaxis protein